MRGILLAKLIREEAPPQTPPPAPQAPVPAAPAAAPSTPDQSQVAPADSIVQKDFTAFKSELKGLENQKTSVIQKWEGAIKKKVSGKKVKVLASKAQHFQPSSEYTIDVSDVKIGWHYDKTTGEIVYDLILMDGDKKYFMKPSQQQAVPQTGAPSQEPETTEAPKTPEAPPAPPVEEPVDSAGGEAPPEGGPESPAPDAPGSEDPSDAQPSAPVPPEEEDPLKKKKPATPMAERLRSESYTVEEIIRDIRGIVEETTGRTNIKPYLVGAGIRKNGRVMFEIVIPKTHLRKNVSSDDIELAFVVKEMKARVSEDFKGHSLNVRVEKYE